MEVVLSTIIASSTLLLSIIKFINEKKFERKNKEFDQFIIILDRVSGKYENGNLMVDTQQIAAVYQLLEFKRFKNISIPVLEHYLEKLENDGDNRSGFYLCVQKVCAELKIV